MVKTRDGMLKTRVVMGRVREVMKEKETESEEREEDDDTTIILSSGECGERRGGR